NSRTEQLLNARQSLKIVQSCLLVNAKIGGRAVFFIEIRCEQVGIAHDMIVRAIRNTIGTLAIEKNNAAGYLKTITCRNRLAVEMPVFKCVDPIGCRAIANLIEYMAMRQHARRKRVSAK